MLDIGSGFQSLRTHIDPSCTYQPCDVVAKTPDTWFIDFNADVYPIVDVSFDVVVCSGVLEYSERPEKFLGRIRSFGHSFLVSYAVALPDLSPRQLKTRGWRNAFTQSGIEDLFASQGYTFELAATWGTKQPHLIYRLRPRAATLTPSK